jgi:small subunit ribosomal protein S6e
MATFKLTIANPKDGKCYKKEVKDSEAQGFIGLNIGENVKGDMFGMSGYEMMVTGGSDYCGFPMRRGILGQRKRVTLLGGVGYKGSDEHGIAVRKTVCGHKVHEKISQINLKITKEGEKQLAEMFPPAEAKK